MKTVAAKSDKMEKKRELRKFGVTMGCAFALFGGLFLWRGKDFYPYLFALSAVFFFFGLVLPAALGPVFRAWMGLAHVMGSVMTRVMLTVLFYLVITPIAVIARTLGKDFLGERIDPDAGTYWIDRKEDEAPERNYEAQF